MKAVICVLGLLAASPMVRAGTCEQDFKAIGDPRNGMYYESSVTRPGLSVSSALGQLRVIGAKEGLTVGQESVTGGSGELALLWEKVRPAIVMKAKATSSGQVTLGVKLAKSQKMTEEEGVANICGMLTKLKAGSEGDQIAKAARATGGAGQVIDIKAEDLSAELKREVERAQRSTVTSKGLFKDALLGTSTRASQAQMNAATAPIVAKYMGRKYRIDGEVAGTSFNQYNDELKVMYLVTQRRGLLGIRESSSSSHHSNFAISCIMAMVPNEVQFFSTLAQGDMARLTGTVSSISAGSMELRDCRQAK